MNFKVGDNVKCVDVVYKTEELELNAIYKIKEIYPNSLSLKVEGVSGWLDASRFVLAEPEAKETKNSVWCKDCVGCEMETVFSIECKCFIPRVKKEPSPATTPEQNFDEAMKAAWKEPRQSYPTPLNCAVTKIIHNGTTTITLFADGSKIITRPSEGDAAKYDPYVGWCVGVTAKLFGGKEKAKKFYKSHAVVQKTPAAKPTEQKERVCNQNCMFSINGVCSKPQIGNVFYDSRILPEGVCGSWGEPEPSKARKKYDDMVKARRCRGCADVGKTYDASCGGCYSTTERPNFAAKPFEE